MIEIINELLFLHLVGCLYYCFRETYCLCLQYKKKLTVPIHGTTHNIRLHSYRTYLYLREQNFSHLLHPLSYAHTSLVHSAFNYPAPYCLRARRQAAGCKDRFSFIRQNYIFFILAQQPPPLPVGHGLLIHEVSRSHITTHHSR